MNMTGFSVEKNSKKLFDLVNEDAPDLIQVEALLEASASPDWANPDEIKLHETWPSLAVGS